jgi:tetratricopeptide (TPR) repeat protein
MAKLRLGSYEEAVASFRRANEINRNFPAINFNLAAALARLGRLDEARSAVKAGFALEPGFSLAHSGAFWATMSDDPTYQGQTGDILDAMRKAGVPEE